MKTKLDFAIEIADWEHRYPKYVGVEWAFKRLRDLMKLSKADVVNEWKRVFE